MSDAERKESNLSQVEARVRERWPGEDAERIAGFVRLFYQGVAPEDIAYSRIANLYGAALSQWNLAHQHTTGEPKIHVYDPDPEQHGWECQHSVVQIVTDDMPFLVDSVSMALNRRGQTVHLIIHPVFEVERDAAGRLLRLADQQDSEQAAEAWMHFEIDRQIDEQALREIHADIARVLEDVRLTVSDWRPMRAQLDTVIEELNEAPAPVDAAERDEVCEFLRWVRDDHFTLLGYRRYDLKRGKRDELRIVRDTGLGLLRRNEGRRAASASFAMLPDDVRSRARDPHPLLLTKSNTRATVHRPGYMDYIGIKRYNAKGEVVGEHRFIGLYTSSAYSRNPRTIPLLRRKVDCVLKRADLRPNSHAGKALINILDTYPRDELFQSSLEELFHNATGILHLQERQRVRLFVRYDAFRRFVSCLVYAPRERYNTEVREKMQDLLTEAFDGDHSEFSVQLSESILARIHFIVRLKEPGRPDYDHPELERRIAESMRSWRDELHDGLIDHFGEAVGNRLSHRYGEGFGAAYREDTGPRSAALDIERLETLDAGNALAMSLFRPLEAPEGMMRFKLFQAERPTTLSDVLPVLENMGVRVIDEHPYDVRRGDGKTFYIHDFGLRYSGADQLETERVRDTFQEAFRAIWLREAESDGMNRLVLAAGLGWRDIVIVRAYVRYLRQAGTPYSQEYVENALSANPRIIRRLVDLFYARFDPKKLDERVANQRAEEIESDLENVASLDEDRILRRLLAAIQGTLRTNHFRADTGKRREYLSLKLEPGSIPGMPKPVPAYEIFIYSPRVEGVHLRGGKVAPGGLRWSDRREDYRTEILGLMKAQMVKNAVIVPVGAKGGFVCKHLPEDRQALQEEVLHCYRTFIRALLDLTDNIAADGTVLPPADVVRHDDDDPYLVVAADKGTATFSDVANGVAEEYGFWLRDAFASRGSSGYDHKKMGITARGGWEAVKRHFREMGRDIQTEPFSVVGVGDMSGDVFGNGMLLSPQTRLIAAFDPRHIFIDPDPDIAAGFAGRERLFALDRSNWDDYDRALISKGGGVWPRTAKSIAVPKEARAALGTEASRLAPTDLISAILLAPVDLLWNGGIGTYVKAADESHLDVGDKANDTLRVDAVDLRCQVIGEGGNLGVTQRGRVEYAQTGGRINTDAIDNAGGVDCSDHEVNIKILLNRVVDAGDMTLKQRNRLLRDMTEEVSQLVLRSNYRQTQAVSLMQARAPDLLDEHTRFMRSLERAGDLERAVESLPDEERLIEMHKAGHGLTRPELAVLLAYAKIEAFGNLLSSELVKSDYPVAGLLDYFPQQIRERFAAAVRDHPLRAEIIATLLANHICNRMGATFLSRTREGTGASFAEVARAYFVARDVFGLRDLWHEVDALDNRVDTSVQYRLLLAITHLQERVAVWLLHNVPAPVEVEQTIARIRPALEQLESGFDELLPDDERERLQNDAGVLTGAGVPEDLARRVARLDPLYAALDLLKVCTDTETRLERAAAVYFAVANDIGIGWLRDSLADYQADDPWQERYRAGLEEETYVQMRRLTLRILQAGGDHEAPAEELVEHWAGQHVAMATRLQRTLAELRAAAQVDLAMLGVALQELRNLTQAGSAQDLLLAGARANE